MSNSERQKRYRERMKALREVANVTKTGESVTDVVGSVTPVTVEWDKERYPNRKAWEIAVVSAERAKRYAGKFGHLIREGDLIFQDIGWQYENEGLKAVRQNADYTAR